MRSSKPETSAWKICDPGIHRCWRREFWGGAKDILPELPKFSRKTVMRQNIPHRFSVGFSSILTN